MPLIPATHLILDQKTDAEASLSLWGKSGFQIELKHSQACMNRRYHQKKKKKKAQKHQEEEEEKDDRSKVVLEPLLLGR